ncbi:SsrA-binding protein SmpB [Telmatocola sphagniphila]|uniref:SsrA-binding protein n=1 Tax=Telmatocola sphagniphila TaxID=1123043 RepID=A0A8E6EU89_9BACT|nr:SsrA-binding protein SmpB [Telmatocola sphagniphila]QVL33409.1 SsrA-binding protein SmpB [Telmatocola sphagniphila]
MAKDKTAPDEIKVITRNRRAFHEYEILEKIECGIVLVGTEVKTLRDGHCNLEDSYAHLNAGELWLLGCEIPEYSMGNRLNHKPKRDRKLLLHRREIDKFAGKATQKGFTLVPLQMYFKAGRAKIEIAIAKGKQLHDKRDSIKDRESKRDLARAIATRRKS